MTPFELTISWIAPLLTISSFIAQFFLTLKTRDVSSINPYSQLLTIFASGTWMIFAGGSGVFGTGIDEFTIFPFVFVTYYASMRSNGFSNLRTAFFSFLSLAWIAATSLFFLLCTINVIDNEIIKSWASFFGIMFGGTIICISFVPQLLQTFRTKDVSALSVHMYIFYSLGQVGLTALFISLSITTYPYESIDMFTIIWSIVTAVIPLIVHVTILILIFIYKDNKVSGENIVQAA